MSSGRLAELTGLTTGAITGVVDRLAKAGYAKRKADPNDRRATIIEARNIDAFEKRTTPLFEPLSNKSAETLAAYDVKELRLILEFVRTFVTITQEETRRLRSLKK